MAESMHNSSDIPNFDTYPSTPPDRLLDTKSVGRSSLEERAAELGAAAGRIALILRQTKENVENLAQHEIYDRVTNLAETAKVADGSRCAGMPPPVCRNLHMPRRIKPPNWASRPEINQWNWGGRRGPIIIAPA